MEKKGWREFYRGGCLARDCECYLSFSVNLAQEVSQETDKATIDVEAQEDGIMGKILVREQNFMHQYVSPS